MSAGWLSSPELSRGVRARARAGLLILLLGAWSCEREQPTRSPPAPVVNNSPYPYPLCLEYPHTYYHAAESLAGCLIEDYLKTTGNLAWGWQMRACARSAYAIAEQHFAEGNFHMAWDLFGNSKACLPSYRAIIREGDAVFHRNPIVKPGQGGLVEPSGVAGGCTPFYPDGVEVVVNQTYEVALLFYPFELEQTGRRVPEQELIRTRYKADCLRRLARRYSYLREACAPPSLFRQCLEGP